MPTETLPSRDAALQRYRLLMEHDTLLRIGQPVTVRWGYGLGFRATGTGTVVKLSPKSVQVRLLTAVQSPSDPHREGWPAGFVLKGIPRFNLTSRTWNYWNCVEPLPHHDLVASRT